MSNYVIECNQVQKKYKDMAALNGLDLKIPKGSIYGLLGKNGAGKTTLLKCIMGMLNYQSGSISVLGVSPKNLDNITKARIGYVPQKIELYPWMKVGEITDYIGSFYTRWNHELVTHLIGEWELNINTRISALSVGQTQKLAIILALGHEPELLVLDEPAASLDPAARRQFLKTILDLSNEHNQTVIFSTHITADIERVADSIGILKEGKTIFSGELDALKDSVKKIHLTARSSLPNQLACEGLLTQDIRGNEALVTVNNCNDALLLRLKSYYATDVEVLDLGLEDIFLALQH